MASSKEYLDYVLEQISGAGDISFRPMMGEYIIYRAGKVIGGIYDDRFLLKPTASALSLLPDAPRELPYEGAKEMLLIEELDDKPLVCGLVKAVADDLPEPRRKNKR